MQHAGMGDLVWLVPYFRAVAADSLDGQVTVIAPPSTFARELVGHERWVREVIDFDRRPRRSEKRQGRHSGLPGLMRMGEELRPRRIERVALFSERSARAAFACAWGGIPERLGYGTGWVQRRLLTPSAWIERYAGPAVAAYKEATAFSIAQGWCTAPLVPRLAVEASALATMARALAGLPRPVHALAIGASEPFKQWGEGRFVELATRLCERGHCVLLIGGRAESALGQAIFQRIAPALQARVKVMTENTVRETVAVLSLADSCIGNDTGAANIAAATGTPTWVVLGPRPSLEHDPQTLHLIQAPSLDDILPADVARQVLAAL
jgi:heptosyltransferase-2